MSNPIDVGSVLGGRYKVTATVLASHDHDLVLRPERIQAWRESNELAGRLLMRDGAWLD